MYLMPFGMSQGNTNTTSSIDELDKTIKFYEAMKKSFNEDKDKDKKKDPPKKPGDLLSIVMFFTMAVPFVGGTWVWFMLTMFVDILEKVAKIKGLH